MSSTGGLINNRNLILTHLEAGKSKTKAQADLVSDEGPPFLLHGCSLLAHTARGEISLKSLL